jgi:hypothetical protein
LRTHHLLIKFLWSEEHDALGVDLQESLEHQFAPLKPIDCSLCLCSLTPVVLGGKSAATHAQCDASDTLITLARDGAVRCRAWLSGM